MTAEESTAEAAPVGGRESPSVRQRLVIVSPSTGQFDSRVVRFASSAASRGHAVTILARWRAGLPEAETLEDGVRVARLRFDAFDALPGGRWLRQLAGRADLGAAGSGGATGAPVAGGPSSGTASAPPTARSRRAWLVDRLRLPLSIRAQTRAARRLGPPADVFMGRGFAAIPTALDLARRHRAAAIYDIGDVYMEARNLARIRGPLRRWLASIERGWAHRAAALTTTNDAYADILARNLRAGRPTVLLNTPPRWTPPSPPLRRFHEMLDLEPETRVVLYHGGLVEERGIEQLVEAIDAVEGAILVLMGYGVMEARLRTLLHERPDRAQRVRMVDPVPPRDLLSWVASADVVAMPVQPTTLNHRYTTPNKLWEAVAAGVPVLASDLPGMAAIVREVDGGVVVDPTRPDAIAAGLRELLAMTSEQRSAMRARLLDAARERYCWEAQEPAFLELLGRLTGRPW